MRVPFKRSQQGSNICEQRRGSIESPNPSQYRIVNEEHNIKAVMTCAKGHHTNIPRSRLEMFEYFPFDDHESCQISPYFEKACDFIADAV